MNQAASITQAFENDVDLPVGEILRRARMQYGQSLKQVEMALRIRAVQLGAIEEGNLELLPGRVYAIGFVRSYSEYLGLDANKMVRLFKAQSLGTRASPELHFPALPLESKTPSLYVVLGGLGGVAVLLVLWSVFYMPGPPNKIIPPVPEILKKSSITEAPAIGIKPKIPAPKKEKSKRPKNPYPDNRVVIEVREDSWIQIQKKDGTTLLRSVLKKGDVYLVPNEEGFVLTTGNAGGFILKIDGKETLKLGSSAQVKRKVSLNPEDLLKKIGK